MRRMTSLVVLFLWSFFTIAGCVPTAEFFVGRPVTSAPIVWLDDTRNAAGTWQTFDMTINYSYSADGDIVELAGQGQLSQHYQMVYDGVRSLRLYLFLLDADGLVGETINIPVFPYSTQDTFSFTKFFRTNADVKGFSFGYRGVVTEMDGHGYFENLPGRPAL